MLYEKLDNLTVLKAYGIDIPDSELTKLPEEKKDDKKEEEDK
jgi:hypothetical protein